MIFVGAKNFSPADFAILVDGRIIIRPYTVLFEKDAFSRNRGIYWPDFWLNAFPE
jgi:hypothetical protein